MHKRRTLASSQALADIRDPYHCLMFYLPRAVLACLHVKPKCDASATFAISRSRSDLTLANSSFTGGHSGGSAPSSVVGDASGCGIEADDAPTLERINRFFAPVLSAGHVAGLLEQSAARRASVDRIGTSVA